MLAGCGRVNFDDAWLQVIDFDASRDACPGEWISVQAPVVCARNEPSLAGGVRSASFTPPAAYQRILGYVAGYQFGSMDGFGPSADVVDGLYADGVSITYRDATNARQHVWTYAAGWSNVDFEEPGNHCPCDGGAPPPDFVGESYYCASGHNDITRPSGAWYVADPLWDGATPAGGCDTAGDPSWFVRELPEPTESPIEVRLMSDQESACEDVGVFRLALFVQ